MRKKLAVGVVAAVAVAGGGVAWAALGGFLVTPNLVQGLVVGSGSVSCQTGGVTFTVPTPTWSNTAGDYMVSTLNYSGINTTCVNLGTADLVLNITSGGTNSLANATATNMSTAAGTLNLSTAIPYDDAVSGRYVYFVKDN